MTELLIENARVIDGTGSPWFRGSVAVTSGQITAVNRGEATAIDADQRIDADGRVVCPGFIDTHSHSDLRLFEDATLAPKIQQGITTEILGQDGFSTAPLYREDGVTEWEKQLRPIDGATDTEWSWGSLGAYLDAVEASGVAPNVGTLVGHGTVRFDQMGMTDRAPDEAELSAMADSVTEALEDGALGFSTGLIYTPCSYADTDEVRELASRLTPFGRPFVAHIRSEGRWIWEALDEFIDIGAEQGVPLHLSHFKVAGAGQHGRADRAIGLLETARDRGVDITAEQYPYTAGSTMLSAVLPPWVHADGSDETVETLRDPEIRERIRRDIEEWRIEGWENLAGLAGWDNVVIADVESEANAGCEGESIAAIARAREIAPVEAVCDLLVEETLGVSMTVHLLDETDVREILSCERVCIGSDGLFGGRPHPRVYGTYPRILGTYVREENLLTLEEAVRRMTALPARVLGLDRKGLVRPGMDADLVVLDPVRVGSRATYEHPQRPPDGIDHVVVDGESVVRDGRVTGATPGSAIRKGAD